MNSELWNTGRDEDKQTARERKRRLHYVSNIMVISDSANPQNEGKVFLYKFGKKIFDKVMDIMQPQFADEKPVNPFDFWEGADFRLKIRKVEGWTNYDKSDFATPSAVLDGDDARLEELYTKLYALNEFTDPANYKSYADLKAKMNRVLGVTAGVSMEQAEMPSAPVVTTTFSESPAIEATDSGEEDTLSYFAKLANDG
jgi:hypothetical protein